MHVETSWLAEMTAEILTIEAMVCGYMYHVTKTAGIQLLGNSMLTLQERAWEP